MDQERKDYADLDLAPPRWWVAGVLYPVAAGAIAFSASTLLALAYFFLTR